MLRAPPWARLPLTVRWLRPDFRQELSPAPPPHMPIAFGPPPCQPLVQKRHAAASDADIEPQPHLGAQPSCSLCARVLQVGARRGAETQTGPTMSDELFPDLSAPARSPLDPLTGQPGNRPPSEIFPDLLLKSQLFCVHPASPLSLPCLAGCVLPSVASGYFRISSPATSDRMKRAPCAAHTPVVP